ncbi:gamma-glutamyl-gamma-aminobutyrate hydrolase family protein [Castellaniella sp.]|uniref:gamma-glutamyl-gamma-aminobutyrate hydrolase family protein n=1 Tax=Castellaniella sp. TaxID=1955812 RepID=UPI0035653AC9
MSVPVEKNTPKILITVSVVEYRFTPLWIDIYRCFHDLGACPVAIDTTVPKIDLAELIGKVDGLVIGGGQDVNPALYGGNTDDPSLSDIDDVRDANEAALYRLAVEQGKPVLAICRGMQLINALSGGTLIQDIRRDHGSSIDHDDRTSPDPDSLSRIAHSVSIKEGSRLSQVLGHKTVIDVNSGHHQAIGVVGKGFDACAWSADGLVEAIEPTLESERIMGVQWHPENLYRSEDSARTLLRWFIGLCDS